MNLIKIISFAFILIASLASKEAKACMINDVAATSIIMKMCHTCIFPLTIGGVKVAEGPMDDPSDLIRSPICICTDPFPRVGVPVSFLSQAELSRP